MLKVLAHAATCHMNMSEQYAFFIILIAELCQDTRQA